MSTLSILTPKDTKWLPDSNIADCQYCRKKFHFCFRKHHCRNCGKIFCNECCPYGNGYRYCYPCWESTLNKKCSDCEIVKKIFQEKNKLFEILKIIIKEHPNDYYFLNDKKYKYAVHMITSPHKVTIIIGYTNNSKNWINNWIAIKCENCKNNLGCYCHQTNFLQLWEETILK